MLIKYTLQGTVEVPEGSKITDPRMIELPNGQWIKLFTTVELNDDQDLSYQQQNVLGIEVEDCYCSFNEQGAEHERL